MHTYICIYIYICIYLYRYYIYYTRFFYKSPLLTKRFPSSKKVTFKQYSRLYK